jgi:adenylate kinase family enzyme
VERVMIVGCSGAEKSTLAGRLAKHTKLPVTHLDQIFWTSGWVNRPREETRRLISEVIQGDRWIFEGNHSSSFDLRIARADTVIFLDFPVPLCLFRIAKRVMTHFGRDSPYEVLPTQKVCLGSVSHAISLHLTVGRSVIRLKKDQLAAIL